LNAAGDRAVSSQPISAVGVMLPGEGIQLAENETKTGKVLLAGASRVTEVGDTVAFTGGSVHSGLWTVKNNKRWAPEGAIIYEELEVGA
jgi:hypothetical protein